MTLRSVGQENGRDIEINFSDHGTGQPMLLIHGYALVETSCPTGNGETVVEFSIDPALFHETLAADLPADQAARHGPAPTLGG
jgi:hypothetical protein